MIPFIWAGALSSWLLAQSMASETWAKWLIAIVVVTLAVAVSSRVKPNHERTSVTLLVGLALLFTFTSANASMAEASSSPKEVMAQAQSYSTIECTVRVTQIDRFQALGEVMSSALPNFSASVIQVVRKSTASPDPVTPSATTSHAGCSSPVTSTSASADSKRQ